MTRPLSERGTHLSLFVCSVTDLHLSKYIRTHTVLCLAHFKMRKSFCVRAAPMMLPASVALVALLATGTTSALVVQIDPFASDSIRVRVAPPGVAAVANPPLQVRSRACAACAASAGVKKAAQHGVLHVMNDRVHGCCPLAESSLLTPSSSLPFLRLHVRHLFSPRLTLPCVSSFHETSHPQPCAQLKLCAPLSPSLQLPLSPHLFPQPYASIPTHAPTLSHFTR
jgi:hypothetical protein